MSIKKNTTKSVDEIGKIDFTGNITPPMWYKNLRVTKNTKHGISDKPYLLAICILSDIVYWYKPIYLRDEKTGHLIEVKKKFQSDKLQKNTGKIADFFGVSDDDAREALKYLVSKNLISIEYRMTEIGGVMNYNVMYIDVNSVNIEQITMYDLSIDKEGYSSIDKEGYSSIDKEGYSSIDKEGYSSIDKEGTSQLTRTNTENTTENTYKEYIQKNIRKKQKNSSLEETESRQNGATGASSFENQTKSDKRKNIAYETAGEIVDSIWQMLEVDETEKNELKRKMELSRFEMNDKNLKLALDKFASKKLGDIPKLFASPRSLFNAFLGSWYFSGYYLELQNKDKDEKLQSKQQSQSNNNQYQDLSQKMAELMLQKRLRNAANRGE